MLLKLKVWSVKKHALVLLLICSFAQIKFISKNEIFVFKKNPRNAL